MKASSPDAFKILVNDRPIQVSPGTTVAAAIAQAGISCFRRSLHAQPRGPLCGMGICFECRVTINGQLHSPSCQRLCEPGMQVRTDE